MKTNEVIVRVCAGLLMAHTASAQCNFVTQEQRLVASDAVDGDQVGFSVAISGDTMVTGAPRHDALGVDSGAAYVWTRTGTTWTQVAKLLASDGAVSHQFGTAVDILGDMGDTILVGSPLATSTLGFTGAVYVFTRSAGTWTQTAKLDPTTATSAQSFGSSVAIFRTSDGTVAAVVGAPRDGGVGIETGSATFFTRSASGTWVNRARVVPTLFHFSHLGGAVAGEGGLAVIAAPDETVSSVVRAGAVYVYSSTPDGSAWTLETRLTAPVLETDNMFGDAVSLSGTTLAVGAPGAGGGVRLYTRASPGVWNQQAYLSDGLPTSRFGCSVCVQGDLLGVGAYNAPGGGAFSTYTRSSGVWSLEQSFAAVDTSISDRFGWDIDMDQPTFAVGAMMNSPTNGLPRPGTAYAIRLSAPAVATVSTSSTVCAGEAVTLTVEASGNPTLTYAWHHNGVPIPVASNPSAATASLVLPSFAASDAGNYRCLVSNSCGVAASNEITVNMYCSCATSQLTLQAGVADEFSSGNGNEPAAPNSALVTALAPLFSNPPMGFDFFPTGSGPGGARAFAHTFAALPNDVLAGSLSLRLRGGGSGNAASDDTVRLGFASGPHATPVASFWSRSIAQLISSSWSSGTTATVTLDLANLPQSIGGPVSLLANLNASGLLDVVVEDRTAVDHMVLTLTRDHPQETVVWIPSQPSSFSMCASDAGFLTVDDGSPSIEAHQWQVESPHDSGIYRNLMGSIFGELPLGFSFHFTGATSPTLNFFELRLGDHPRALRFRHLLSNSCSTATSDPALVTIQPCCIADVDDGSGTGLPDGGVTIDDLIHYLFLFESGSGAADVDDGGGTGLPDGGVTIDDLLYYLFRFEAGC